MVFVLVEDPSVTTAVSCVGCFARPPKRLRGFEECWDGNWLLWVSQEERLGCLWVVLAADDDGWVEEDEEERKRQVKRRVGLESKGR